MVRRGSPTASLSALARGITDIFMGAPVLGLTLAAVAVSTAEVASMVAVAFTVEVEETSMVGAEAISTAEVTSMAAAAATSTVEAEVDPTVEAVPTAAGTGNSRP
jgi:hypothetical protein